MGSIDDQIAQALRFAAAEDFAHAEPLCESILAHTDYNAHPLSYKIDTLLAGCRYVRADQNMDINPAVLEEGVALLRRSLSKHEEYEDTHNFLSLCLSQLAVLEARPEERSRLFTLALNHQERAAAIYAKDHPEGGPLSGKYRVWVARLREHKQRYDFTEN